MSHSLSRPLIVAICLSSLIIVSGPVQASDELDICQQYLSYVEGQPPNLLPPHKPYSMVQYLSVLRTVSEPVTIQWPTKTIYPMNPVTLARAKHLIDLFKDEGSDLNREMAAHIAELGGFQSQTLWDTYFLAYDKLAGFTPGLLDVGAAMGNFMPRSGLIGDFGSGTGNMLAMMAQGNHERSFVGVDLSPRGNMSADAKLLRIFRGDRSRYFLRTFDLKTEALPPEILDGAVMNNVLYTLGEHRRHVLENIYASLKPGAPFVLSDVIDFVLRDRERLVYFLTSAAMKAIESNAPATEYDFALAGKINLQVLMNPGVSFLTGDELLKMSQETGFQIEHYFRAYYGAANFLVLRKPIR